jgi:hypothetical protein
MQTPSFEAAIRKAKVKRIIAEQLATLPTESRRDILADLLLALDDAIDAGPIAKPNGATSQVELLRAKPVQEQLLADTPLGGAARPGRPSHSGSEMGRTDAVYAALKAQPRTPIAELAKLVYPDQPDASHRVRAILWSLKKQKRARNPEPGKWEVMPERP